MFAVAIIGLTDGQDDHESGPIVNLAYEIKDEIGAISEEVCSPSPELDKVRKRINARWGFQDGGTGLDDGHESASAVIVVCRIECNFC